MISPEIYHKEFIRLRCCVLIPTYNNSSTLSKVLDDVLAYCKDVIVVIDGSTDNTLEILSRYPSVKVHSYLSNVGKGWALRQGFDVARNLGYEYAITIDSDGQHYADDLPVFLRALEHNKKAVIIGSRNMNQSSVPGKSSFGNKFSNFWFTLETGITLPDTQSGYRLYPIKELAKIHFFTRKYEFEIEVIVRSAWRGIKVISVPVKVYYPPAGERISHFRPFKDFSRISILNTVLVFWTFAFIKPRDFIRSLLTKKITTVLDEYLILSHETPEVKAWSVANGVFFGITPFWGFQIWFVLFFAWIFKLNKAISILASNISIPPMIPIIVFASYQCGRIWFGGNSMSIRFSENFKPEMLQKNFLQYVVGSFILATILAIFSGILTYFAVKFIKGDSINLTNSGNHISG